MELNSYQSAAEATAVYPGQDTDDGITYTVLGLIGEAGELANKWKKYYRDDIPLDEVLKVMGPELGDVLWYVACLASELGYTLEEVGQANLDKLKKRTKVGTIHGAGDTR